MSAAAITINITLQTTLLDVLDHPPESMLVQQLRREAETMLPGLREAPLRALSGMDIHVYISRARQTAIDSRCKVRGRPLDTYIVAFDSNPLLRNGTALLLAGEEESLRR